MSTDLQGDFSPSVYETGQLVRHAPSLSGHARRVRFLLDEQRSDGGWYQWKEYGLVPTLSATSAILSVIRNANLPSRARIGRDELIGSVDRGLHALCRFLNTGEPAPLPDTVAVEIVVPSLIAEINSHLDESLPSELDSWRGRRLRQHPGGNEQLLAGLRSAAGQGQPLPMKLLHSLETCGAAARGARLEHPVRGNVGCSPAATAAWLGDGMPRHSLARYLEAVQRRGGGPVPVAAPLPVFERAWVLSTLASAGRLAPHPRGLVRSLHAAFGELGVAGGQGLPPDADDTATALHALAQLGDPRSPEVLWAYRTPDGHFACFPGERTPSASTNAHVLQAFDACLHFDLPHRTRYPVAMARIAAWLYERQEPDGSWTDKWHASPYYATACCARALAGGCDGRAARALSRAVAWLLDTQRPDGSWGRWAGTYEETAYAVQTLVQARNSHAGKAVARGCARLRRDAGPPYPPLWHDKDLYTPNRIVRAEGLAALRLAARAGFPRRRSVAVSERSHDELAGTPPGAAPPALP